jgi:hypothetical protein
VPKKTLVEMYCFGCEKLLLEDKEKLGPICPDCYKKTRRKDPLMAAALAKAVVAVVPTICPHDEERRHGRCKFGSDVAGHFNVIVLNKKLEPVEITGPYSLRQAERRAERLRKKHERRGK